ncbi:hybrid sensor histidine kinase/response regulator [Sphingomonas sp. PR090111-T3T-6A]|uniref:hybrid sensor histidine kinase/response regulator n=1 Tax=Sphingomonas sp. PR090111-T3T-6A TaxID=685778 RepID=UPI000364B97F|nr:hybrid sensor histidine kinase/response regulator [Sphingomonas sp. PR090111-T3T-6A]
MTDLSQFSMRDLFGVELDNQAQVLVAGLLALEQDPAQADQLEACMRAAHSLKGAARIVDMAAAVTLAHAMEELFVAAQAGRLVLERSHIDKLLQGVDLLKAIALEEDTGGIWQVRAEAFVTELEGGLERTPVAQPVRPPEPPPAPARIAEAADRALRVSVDSLNQLLDLSGEALVESRRLKPFGQALHQLKRLQHEAAKALEALRDALPREAMTDAVAMALTNAQNRMGACRHALADRIAEVEGWDQQSGALAHRLYDQALKVRMRPFADGVQALPRMVRDVAHSLGKEVRLEIEGEATQVDRDILERLDAPLGHLLRNAVDHGIESPEERRRLGKPEEGRIRLEAYHSAGTLQVVLSDDGHGVDPEQIRQVVLARGLAPVDVAGKLGEAELFEFLFLPGFSMKESVSEISGRGVGLDAVQDMIRQVGGRVRVSSEIGGGTRFQLQLPLTLSVTRALLVEIGGEPYAFPFARILRTLKVARADISTLGGREYFSLDDRQIGLVSAHQVLDCGPPPATADELSVVMLGAGPSVYGLVVDRFLGGRELVVQPLDPRLGKVKDIAAGALMEDGSPLLIVDVEDMVRSMEKLAAADRLKGVERDAGPSAAGHRRRILIVDDSFTVRELQRKVLEQQGYEVEVAVDGMDGWNVVRTGGFDLVITDIDMPRMDGIALVGLIRQHAKLGSLPVMILSYKDREEDRRRGLDAGADHYLTKGSFHSDGLVQAVADLIGAATA